MFVCLGSGQLFNAGGGRYLSFASSSLGLLSTCLHHALFPVEAVLHSLHQQAPLPSSVQLRQPTGGPRWNSEGGRIERSEKSFLWPLLGEVASGYGLQFLTLLLARWPTLHDTLSPRFQINMLLIFSTSFFSHSLQYSNEVIPFYYLFIYFFFWCWLSMHFVGLELAQLNKIKLPSSLLYLDKAHILTLPDHSNFLLLLAKQMGQAMLRLTIFPHTVSRDHLSPNQSPRSKRTLLG